jgi:glycosyltransferase involved in cell wall biosynthesis
MREPVSAILPVKNGQPWIRDALKNIDEVLGGKDELIVVDDNSSDSSWALLHSVSLKTAIKIVRNPGNGIVSALNEGINLAQHEWIARFDIDDKYHVNRISDQFSVVNAKVVAVFTDYRVVSETGRDLGIIPSPVHSSATVLSLVNSDRTAHPSVIFRKMAAISVGLYKENDFPCEDLSLWLRLSKVGKLVSVPTVDLIYTLRNSSVSGGRYDEAKERTKSLLHASPQVETYIDSAFENFKEIMELYRGMVMGEQRSLLFFRDLYKAMAFKKFTRKQRMRLNSVFVFFILSPKNFLAGIKLLKLRRRRKLYRSLD